MTMTDIFKIEKTARKGLFAAEWAVVAYLVVTTALILWAYPRLPAAEMMLIERARIAAITVAMVIVYRMIPCPATRFARVIVQMAMLSWWYPDTYELNRILPNLDHIFAGAEQDIFGCQPALLFAQTVTSPIVSELMALGYVAFYPLIGIVTLYFFLFRQKDFLKAAFIIIAAFMVYYVVFIALPVAGPQYYFPAVGMENVARGILPDIGDYFAVPRPALPTPGYENGVFYRLVVEAHNAGERPTAAFPSSHVGIASILMMLVWQARGRRLAAIMAPFYVLLCFSTVYIYAHYVVDVIGGWLSAALIYASLSLLYNRIIKRE